jgi:predicted nuclease of restriction endonuclease-like (RecB) superfamily
MKVAVIGAGTMGSGIAQAFAQCAEVEKVYLCDIKVEFAQGGFNKIKGSLEKQVSKGKIEQAAADAILAKFECGLNTIAVDPDLVVEAALEVMDIKKKCFQELQDEIVKNPVIAEFLGLENTDYSESNLEQAIINHLQKFIMEMGRGFAYMGRQQLIRTDTQDYYIDLVFYNVVLKCYVLIDLKVGVITHQDVGQMDMYVRMYDELRRTEGDNPTIGIVLCSETSKDIARYSILKGN